jgi:hypothetical protein
LSVRADTRVENTKAFEEDVMKKMTRTLAAALMSVALMGAFGANTALGALKLLKPNW